jgi:2-keto-4-pentenoate hydratase
MNEQALDVVWAGATSGAFDPAGHEVDLTEGQDLQLQLLGRWRDRGERVGGWKLGMTSGQSRDAFGIGFRPFGFILNSRITQSGGQLSISRIGRGGIENELCFLIGKPLGQSATKNDAIDAVAGVSPAFEVNQRRIRGDATPGIRIADDLANWGLVVGPMVEVPSDLDSLTVVLSKSGEEVQRVTAAGHIDDHYQSLATLARKLAEHGLKLQPGDRVITGAFTRTVLEPGRYVGDFGALIGQVSVEVVA